MIEALFNNIKYFILFNAIAFSICLSNGNLENISDKITPSYQSIFKNIGLDFRLNSNDLNDSYLGMQWMVSHNMSLDFKTAVNFEYERYSDITSHNIIGANLILNQNKDYKFILSILANKLRYTDSGHYTWIQNSLIFLRKYSKYSYQFVFDQIQINNSSSVRFNFITGYNIFENIFLYFGIYQSFDSKKSLNSFYSIGFNL